MIQMFFAYSFTLFAAFALGQKCENGVDNIIRIKDISKGKSWIQFDDVKIATFDANLEPHCSEGLGALHLPGFIRIISGVAEVRKAIDTQKAINLDLSAEQNSFLIGQICANGKSLSSFIPSDYCSLNFCKTLGENSCKFLEQTGRMNISDFYSDYISFKPFPYSQIEGDWKLSAQLKQNGVELAKLSLHHPWYAVTMGDEQDVKQFYSSIKLLKEKEEKHNDEL